MTRDSHGTALIIGGGFFGCNLALYAQRRGLRAIVVERKPQILGAASRINQARVHGGYHYPRSFLTARRSRASYARFMSDYSDCVDRNVEAYYAIAKTFSKVSAEQFVEFCRRIEAPVDRAPQHILSLFDEAYIEDVVRVEEGVFDCTLLRARVMSELRQSQIELRLSSEVVAVKPHGQALSALVSGPSGDEVIACDHVFLCTYERLNEVLVQSELAPLELEQQLVEMTLVDVPPELSRMGVTVMDGPFFSLMPFPSMNCHSFSHVRYTPHSKTRTTGSEHTPEWEEIRFPTSFQYMVKDASRYMPLLSRLKFKDSLWAMKALLPRAEGNDGRPILFRPNHGLKGLHCVMGGKIDNIYDAYEEMDRLF